MARSEYSSVTSSFVWMPGTTSGDGCVTFGFGSSSSSWTSSLRLLCPGMNWKIRAKISQDASFIFEVTIFYLKIQPVARNFLSEFNFESHSSDFDVSHLAHHFTVKLRTPPTSIWLHTLMFNGQGRWKRDKFILRNNDIFLLVSATLHVDDVTSTSTSLAVSFLPAKSVK